MGTFLGAEESLSGFQLQSIDLSARSYSSLPLSVIYQVDKHKEDGHIRKVDYSSLYDGFVTELAQNHTSHRLINGAKSSCKSFKLGTNIARKYKIPSQGLIESGFMECEFIAFCNFRNEIETEREGVLWYMYCSKEIQKKIDLAAERAESGKFLCKIKGFISPSGTIRSKIEQDWYSRIVVVKELSLVEKSEKVQSNDDPTQNKKTDNTQP